MALAKESSKWIRWGGLAALLLAMVALPCVWGVFKALATTNEHAVIPGQVYRSGQMSAQRLREFVRKMALRR